MENVMAQMYKDLYSLDQVPKEPEYTKVCKQLSDLINEMQIKFPTEYYDLVDKVFELQIIIDSYEFEKFFQTGLSIGLTLVREAEENLSALNEGIIKK